MIEKTFVKKAIRNLKIDEYLNKELAKSDYAFCEIHRTPINTRIIIYADRPGKVIGKSGRKIAEITHTLEKELGVFKPHIEVRDVFDANTNARLIAKYIVSGLERGFPYKKLVNNAISRVMGAGAIGIEISIAGKISGERSRVEKFREGYLKKCGYPAVSDVDKAKEMVVLKQGALGIQVSIMRTLPDIMKLEKEMALKSEARKEEELKKRIEAKEAEKSESEEKSDDSKKDNKEVEVKGEDKE